MEQIISDFGELFNLISQLFAKGGWVVLIGFAFYLFWTLMVMYNENKFMNGIKWICLSIDVPKDNEQTFLAMEQIFAHLHTIGGNKTFGEKYFHGEINLWFSFEIVSFGGQIKYLVYLPEKYRNLLEAAIYAQYPAAEIRQVDDYIKNVPVYNPKTSYYDMFGVELMLKKPDAYPIRTYRAFEHQASQIIVDPLSAVLESLSGIEPHELMAVQYLISPADDDWKESARQLVNDLKGAPKKHAKPGLVQEIGGRVIHGLAAIPSITAGEAGGSDNKSGDELPSMMQHLSPGEKDTIAAIEMSLGKLSFKTKIRLLYLAPKDKFRKDAKNSLVGAYNQYDDINLNGLKTNSKQTGTNIPFKFSKTLEQPIIDYKVAKRKNKLIRHFKKRAFTKGARAFILNTEELATVFHFPLLTVKAPKLTKTEIRKNEAPINLPVQF